MLTSKSLFLTSKSEMLTSKSLFLTSKSEMLTSKSLFLISKSEMLTSKSLFLTSKSEMLASKSLFLTSKSEMLASKSLFLTSKSEMLTRKSNFLITGVDCQLPPPGGEQNLAPLVPFGGFYNFLQKGRPETHSVRVRAPILYGNPIHRPATATVPQSPSETPATSLFQMELMRVSSAMTTLRRTAKVKSRARASAAIFIQKAFI